MHYRIKYLTIGVLLAVMAQASLKPDQEAVFFETSAYLDGATDEWVVPVHGWVIERKEKAKWLKGAMATLLASLELGEATATDSLFKERTQLFLVDNEKNKKLQVCVGPKVFALDRSQSNGHFYGEFRLELALAEQEAQNNWVPFTTLLNAGDTRYFPGMAQLVEPEGVSVISDIDDAFKKSQVTDKKELVANTFLRPYEAVTDLNMLYQRWSNMGAAFHYVSAFPWQLYPALTEFIKQEEFPRGSIELQEFRAKDQTFYSLFQSPEKTKIPMIQKLFDTYRIRTFILVGDSGEKDPEIYGDIARAYPEQIKQIFIRRLSRQTTDEKRYLKAFSGVPRKKWRVFTDPGELMMYDF